MFVSRKIPVLLFAICMAFTSCKKDLTPLTYNNYAAAEEANLWTEYSPERTTFKLWSPVAQEVVVKLYAQGDGGQPLEQFQMKKGNQGLWKLSVNKDLQGVYYTYQVKTAEKWLDETPGIYATAVGVNGKRAMVLNLATTDPENWEQDKGPEVKSPNDIILYELHVRDITQHESSGSSSRGKFLGLVESGTKNSDGLTTGIDHMQELGVTHVHILPAFDYRSVDESKLDQPQFNWGYDPQNYNAPEGSYSSDPYKAEVRIREFKEMVKGFHSKGMGVILDVVYNHTGETERSNFNLEVPGYYYRHTKDGKWSDAAACGNETASERAMMRKYIVESCKFWVKEYHIDGFRFDLMGIHDIETMNLLSAELKKLNPDIVIYGEGWTAGDSPLPETERALKKHTHRLQHIAAFSDDIRDGLKGSVFEDESKGFVSGAKDTEESVKFGIVGSIQHPQVNAGKVNYSKAPWANEPWQAVNYVSCHDNHTLLDKLKVSNKEASPEELKRMHKLANAVVLTSQGIPFLHAGVDMLRTKNGEHNSYNLPDSINQIDWNWKTVHKDVFDYYKGLVALRKAHPAFRMPSAAMVNEHLEFIKTEPGLIGYHIKGNANGDSWKNILVYYNARKSAVNIPLEGYWMIASDGEKFELGATKQIADRQVTVPPVAMVVLYQE